MSRETTGPGLRTLEGWSASPMVHRTNIIGGNAGGKADMKSFVARRREAAHRMPPIACGHRDPIVCLARPDRPSTYSLTRLELYQEVQRRIEDGWQAWEIEARFGQVMAA